MSDTQEFRIMTDGLEFWVEEKRPYLFGLVRLWSRGMVYHTFSSQYQAERELERRKQLHEPCEVAR